MINNIKSNRNNKLNILRLNFFFCEIIEQSNGWLVKWKSKELCIASAVLFIETALGYVFIPLISLYINIHIE